MHPRSDLPGLTGLVLCGGRSRRMGRDKAAITVGGVTLIERAVAALAGVAGTTLLATGREARYPELGLSTVLDGVEDGGPLAGIEAGLARSRTEWIAVLACDMPRVEGSIFELLLRRAIELDLDACLLAGDHGVEPLCAVYRSTCLAPIRAALQADERKVTSFERFTKADGLRPRVGSLAERELPAGLRDRGLALNLNTPADLAAEVGA